MKPDHLIKIMLLTLGIVAGVSLGLLVYVVYDTWAAIFAFGASGLWAISVINRGGE